MSGRTLQSLLRAVCLLSVLLCTLSCIGCALERVDTSSRTGGVSLTMEVRRDEDSIAVYEVEPDGTITYAGGRKALLGGIDWTGELTDEEAAQLHELIHAHDWFGPKVESTNEPAELHYTIKVRSAAGTRTIRVTGANPRIDPVHELLELAAGRRQEPVLDALPRPSLTHDGE